MLDATMDCACHQMSHWYCACHATSQCNVTFPAPATKSHAPTLPHITFTWRKCQKVNIYELRTCTSDKISRVQATKFHAYKRHGAPSVHPRTRTNVPQKRLHFKKKGISNQSTTMFRGHSFVFGVQVSFGSEYRSSPPVRNLTTDSCLHGTGKGNFAPR